MKNIFLRFIINLKNSVSIIYRLSNLIMSIIYNKNSYSAPNLTAKKYDNLGHQPKRFFNYSNTKLRSRRIFEDVAQHHLTMQLGQKSKLNDFPVIMKKIKDINPDEIKTRRAGVIVYSVDNVNKEIYFYMGIHKDSGDLTDFGGGVQLNENSIKGGIREFTEESHGVFGKYQINDIQECYAAYNQRIIIMFLRIDVNYPKVQNNFINSINNKSELSSIERLTRTEFITALMKNTPIMYSVVRLFLYNMLICNQNFFTLL